MNRVHLRHIAGTMVLFCLVLPSPSPPLHADAQKSWVDRERSEWPCIAMINHISYSDTSYDVAGCAFLLDTGDGILAASAKHVLRYFKSESMRSVSFRGTLKAWTMSPKDAPSKITVVDQLINEDDDESLDGIPSGKDWLLFTVREFPDDIQPLRFRSTPMQQGEALYIVGWRYTDSGPQNIYEGTYVRSEDGSVLISTEALADNKVPGLSGAPVIDTNGDVIGLMSSKAGKMERLSSIDYPNALVKERRLRGSQTPMIRPMARYDVREKTCTREASTCAREMSERLRERGWVGMTPEIDPDTGVISVTRVFPNSPAEKAGLLAGDVVRGLDGVRYSKTNDEAFMRVYNSFRPGVSVLFDIERSGEQLGLEVRIEPIPESVLADWVREHQMEFHRPGPGN